MSEERPKAYGLNRLRETFVVREETAKSMRANRSAETKPERRLRRALWAMGTRGYRKNDKRWPGKPDLYFASAGLCVYVNGCFWHGCPRCSRTLKPATNQAYWEAKIARNQERDAEVAEALELLGLRRMVVWECELKADLPSVVLRILEAIRT